MKLWKRSYQWAETPFGPRDQGDKHPHEVAGFRDSQPDNMSDDINVWTQGIPAFSSLFSAFFLYEEKML